MPLEPQRQFNALVLGDVPEAEDVFEQDVLQELCPCNPVVVTDRDKFAEKVIEPWVDIILLDMAPDGLEVLEEILGHRPMRPVLMVVDSDRAHDIPEAKRKGLHQYILRVDDDELTTELIALKVADILRRLWQPPDMKYPVIEEVFRYAQYRNVHQPFFVVGLHYQCLYVNYAGRRFTEKLYGREAKPAEDIREFPLEEDADSFREHIAEAFDGKHVEAERTFEVLSPSDAHRKLLFQPVIDSDGRAIAVSIACKNIGAEMKLRHREETLWRYFESSPLPLKILDDNLVIYRCNASFAELLGYDDPEAVEGRHIDEFLFGPDADLAREAAESLISREEEYFQRDYRFLRRDDTVLWASHIGFGLNAPSARDGKNFAFAITIDVSREKEAEERAQQAGRMQALGELASGVAHDFNNVLSVVTSFTQVVKAKLQSRDDDSLIGYLDKIEKATDKGSALTRQLMSFGQDDGSERKALHLNEYIRDVATFFDHLLGSHIDVQLDLDPSIPTIELGTGNIDQIIMNLTVNARDAMPDGGTLILRTCHASFESPKSLPHSELAAGDYVIFEVHDTGVGMDEETRDHIFEPFFTTKGEGEGAGTGLGLTTVFRIVDDADGEIHVDSEPGEGTTFTIYFPAAESDED